MTPSVTQNAQGRCLNATNVSQVAKILLWNIALPETKAKSNSDKAVATARLKLQYVRELCEAEKPDMLILVESLLNPTDVVSEVQSLGLIHHAARGRNGIQLYANVPQTFLKAVDVPEDAVHRIKAWFLKERITRQNYLIVAFHGRDKGSIRQNADSNQEKYARNARKQIDGIVRKSRRDLAGVIVIGDFNMNPFDPGMIANDAFNAVSTKREAKIQRRFYNPMWSLFGDQSEGQPGTYYFAGYGNTIINWNVLDQILLCHRSCEKLEGYSVPTTTGTNSLLTPEPYERPSLKISDHLPLVLNVAFDKK